MLISISLKETGDSGQLWARTQSPTVFLCHVQHVASIEGSNMAAPSFQYTEDTPHPSEDTSILP